MAEKDRQVHRITPGRKILLHIGNCAAQWNKSTIPVLNNMRVAFLPPITTSKMRPFDAGVIACVTRRCKSRLFLRVFESFEARVKSFYNVDILTAIRWTETERNHCPSEVIRNRFNH